MRELPRAVPRARMMARDAAMVRGWVAVLMPVLRAITVKMTMVRCPVWMPWMRETRELAEVTDSHYSVTPEGATRMHFIRRLDFRSGNIASSRTHCLEIDLYTDGRAEGRQC